MIRKIERLIVLLLLPALSLSAGGKSEAIRLSDWSDYETEPGLVIIGVLKDSPAEKAGLVRGDILLSIDGRAINNSGDVYDILSQHKAGEIISLLIVHGDEKKTVSIRIEDRLFKSPLGLQFASYPGARFFFSSPDIDIGGVIILDIVEASPADKAGLKKGDLITAVDDVEINIENSLTEVIAGYDPGDSVTIKVFREGKDDLEIKAELGESDNKAFLGVRFHPLPFRIDMFLPGFKKLKDKDMPFFRFHRWDFQEERSVPEERRRSSFKTDKNI